MIASGGVTGPSQATFLVSDGDAQLCGLLGLAVLLWFPPFAGRESINGFPLAFPIVTGPRLPVRKLRWASCHPQGP